MLCYLLQIEERTSVIVVCMYITKIFIKLFDNKTCLFCICQEDKWVKINILKFVMPTSYQYTCG